MKSFVSCLSLLLVVGSAIGEEVPDLQGILDAEGKLVFAHENGVYSLHGDGTFTLRPPGISGEAIDGIWTFDDDDRVLVSGSWGWYNGASKPNDYREMVLELRLSSTTPIETEIFGGGVERRYDVRCKRKPDKVISAELFAERQTALQKN